MGRSEKPTEGAKTGIPSLKGKCNHWPFCNKDYKTAQAFENHKNTCHQFGSLPFQVTAIVHEFPTILFLANVPNPDDPIDLSRSAVLANANSIQVVQESSVLDSSIDLNHNLEENSNNVV